jgi:hypothetical protein
MSDHNDLIPVSDKDSKIEVLLKNDEPVEREVELSLLNVFTNMKKSFRLYAWIILLCMAVGLLAPYSILLLKDKTTAVSAVVTYQYGNASEGKTPDGSNLDVNLIKSSNIVAQALKSTHLSKNVSVNSVAQNISISHMLTDSAKRSMEIMQKMGMELNTIHAGHSNMFLSSVFRDALAGVSGSTIELYDTDGSIGAARASGIGTGVYADNNEAFSTLKKIMVVEPNSATEAEYKEAYEHWKSILKMYI